MKHFLAGLFIQQLCLWRRGRKEVVGGCKLTPWNLRLGEGSTKKLSFPSHGRWSQSGWFGSGQTKFQPPTQKMLLPIWHANFSANAMNRRDKFQINLSVHTFLCVPTNNRTIPKIASACPASPAVKATEINWELLDTLAATRQEDSL